MTRAAIRTVLAAGAIAGVLDILAAFAIYAPRGVAPTRLLQGIASGWLGSSAFKCGAGTAALGLALHFFIATTAALVYYIASRRVPSLLARPVLFGTLYGIAVYGVMTFVIVPHSALTKHPFSVDLTTVLIFLAHIVCVGVPIAFAIRRFGSSARG